MSAYILTSSDDIPNFIIHVTEKEDHFINADIFEITSWKLDNTVCEKELYCHVYMKWDGCCHIWFGERNENNNSNGYLHLCGVDSWKKHNIMMEALYKFAEENIKRFDSDEKWD